MDTTGSKPIDELVRRAIIGDGTAFTALWDANISSIRAYLRKTMKGLDRFYIEDVCSKSFEKAFRQIRSYDPSLGRFEVWLRRIAHNTALDVIDQENRRQRGYVSIDDESHSINVVDTIGDSATDALEDIIETEAREETQSLVDGLPELYRDIAHKRLIEGMQYKEIAEETGLELNTVRTRIRRAKQMLDKMKNLVIVILAALGISLQGYAADYFFFSVDTRNTSLMMAGKEGAPLVFRHYGPTVSNPADFVGYKTYTDSHSVGDIQVYPTAGGRFVYEPALAVTYPDGGLNTELLYESHSVEALKGGVWRTRVYLHDSKQPLRVCLVFDAYQEEDVILTHAEISNDGKKSVLLRDYYSSCLPIMASKYTLTHFNGAWAHENYLETETLTHGVKTIECRDGIRTSQRSNASFLLSLDTDELSEKGTDVIAGALRWSGNYKINFQLTEAGRLFITAGIHPSGAEYTLAKGQTFVTPDMVWTYSTDGAGRASRNLHDWARRCGMYDSSMYCPTLLNSWEGAYFSFNTKTLTDMIDDAASMGLEMFVLDDGWFGTGENARNSDKSGLGDWEENREKIPEGIKYIADYAHSKGLKFGIWIEPEMVNPKSKLYARHPEWVVVEKGREAYQGRNQLLLDLSNPKVQDFVFDVFDRTMQLGDIDYIKWDANRHVFNVGSTYETEQANFWVDYINGLYRVLERIRAKYPKVLLQSCSSGGGRVDYGVLQWANEVWTSDNTDAFTRAYMQYGGSFIYPVQIFGSHISATPNHQTGRILPLKFRCDMAATARLGMEIQPKLLNEAEKKYVKDYLAAYKGYRDIVFGGDLYRISSPYEGGYYSLMYVSKDKKKAVFFAFCLDYLNRSVVPKFRLDGLADGVKYKVTEICPEPSGDGVRRVFWGDGKTFGSDYLMNFGLNMNLKQPYQSTVIMLEAE
ncbi:MAG: sigma-70 family RNA polymerase sigma factor [Bacteroidales bacterium]|nr:sigma-70 family RNA polymerase sigma factor [Bacteroidales bacterium]MBQ9475055.1 sigma-70 family RNA polymerase sigma factor [Bacteroidales bacterium]